MISVVIPTYKNQDIFIKNLKHNISFFENCEVIIVNDNPEISLKKSLTNFKKIILIENNKNLGFSLAVNKGIQQAKGDYILLLNDDVLLNDYSFIKALSHFEKNPKLFAVSFVQKEKNDSLVGHNSIFWKQGMFFHTSSQKNNSLNAWADGGSCMIDKKKFNELHGFDAMYSPFYWEDVDLSYRAMKKGYIILFDSTILVKHFHESTIGKIFSKESIKIIAFRNQMLFIWKNINDSSLLFSHFVLLIFNIVYYTFKGEKAFVKGFIAAISKINKIKRNKYSITDRDILSKFI